MGSSEASSRRPLWALGRRSIGEQLAVLVLVATLPSFLFVIWHLVSEREREGQIALDQVRQLADNAANRVQASLNDYATTLKLIAEQPMVRAMDSGVCDPLINSLVRLNPEFVTIATRDLRGNPICTFLASPPSSSEFADYPWFQEAVLAGTFHASDVFLTPVSRRWVTVLSTPIRNDADAEIGMVVLPLDLLSVNQLVMQNVLSRARVSVLDRQYRVMMRSSPLSEWLSNPAAPQMEALRAAVQASPTGVVEMRDASGVAQIVAYRRLAVTGWLVSAELPRDEIFAAADTAMRNGVLGSLMLLALALGLAWRLARSIVHPLESMLATTHRIAAGDMDARVPQPKTASDVAELGEAFNHMLEARQQAEHALRDSEENLAITLQSIGDAVMATDLQGRVTRMNPVAERLTGWTLADGMGQPLTEVFRIVHAVTREVPVDPVQRVLASGEVVGLANHTALLSRDGSELHISDSAAPIRDAAGNMVGVVLVFSNVSEQYRLQQVLVESEERYRALVDASPVAVVVHQHLRAVFVNPAAVRLLAAGSAAALLGRSIADFVHPDQHALLARRVAQAQENPNEFPMQEWRYLRLDGSVIDVQAQATVIRLDGEAAVQVSFMDITARKQAETRLRENEARFRALTSLSSDWYWEQDAQYRFVPVPGEDAYLTDSASRPHPDSRYMGRKRWEVDATQLTPLQWDEHRADLDARREFRDLQMRFEDPDGTPRWASVSGMPFFDEHGTFCGYRGIGREITAQKVAEEQINALAFYDALTHLPNRRLLIEQLKQALVSHARSHKHGALLFIDLDNFKTLNDTLGHETGDQLLMQVAQRLLSCVREADTVARLGGDEFVVLLQELGTQALDAAANAEHIGHKILAAFAPIFPLSGREYRSTPSIGITLYGDGNQSVEDLLKQADLAMYQAKAAGRNTLRMFDEGMQAAVDARAAMESDLRQAIVLRQFVLHYQPVVDKAGLVSGAEALVRWEHPVRGRVAPGHFIALAESTGLIVPLGQWVLDAACAQLAQWGSSARTRLLSLAVNVSAHQFMEPDFVAQVVDALERSGADPQRLKLELTESLLADNIDDVIRKMSALRVWGVSFSLDDFGTGYSSLSYLKLLP